MTAVTDFVGDVASRRVAVATPLDRAPVARRPRTVPHTWFLLGAPVVALVNATTYATAVYDPVVVVVIGVLIARKYGWQQGRRCAVMYLAVVAALLAAGVALGGHAYLDRINLMTLAQPNRNWSAASVSLDSWGWIGALAVLGAVAVVSGRRLIAVRRTLAPLTLLFVLCVVVRAQAQSISHGWPNSRLPVSTLKPHLDHVDSPGSHVR